MKTKENDIKYCGVRESKIDLAHPLLIHGAFPVFVKFIKDRYDIHIKKDVMKQEKPWTKDPILQSYKFTNVCREHDKESLWVIRNIVNNKELCYEDKLLNCILFRLFNKHQTLELICAPIPFLECDGDINLDICRETFEQKRIEDPEYVFFTRAFNTGGLKRELKWYSPTHEKDMCMRVMKFIVYLAKDDRIHKKIKFCENQMEIHDLLRSYMGIGDFLAYQIFVDFTYIKEFPFSENEFTVAGPGCRRGIDSLFSEKDGMSYEECIFWLRNNWTQLNNKYIHDSDKRFIPQRDMKDLYKEDRTMNVMRLENCLCEFSKYMKLSSGKGRARKYKGV